MPPVTKILGRVAVVNKGNFNPSGDPYSKLDEVYGNNGTITGSFRSLINNNNQPLSNSSAWQLVSKDGAKGDKGDIGDEGPPGTNGTAVISAWVDGNYSAGAGVTHKGTYWEAPTGATIGQEPGVSDAWIFDVAGEANGALSSYVDNFISDRTFQFDGGSPVLFGVTEEKGLLSTTNTRTPYEDAGWDFRLFRNIPVSSNEGTIKSIHLEVVRPGGHPNNCSLIGVRSIDGGIEVLIPSLPSATGIKETFDFNDLTTYSHISFAQYVTSVYPETSDTKIVFTVAKEDVVRKDIKARVISCHIDLIEDMGCVGDGVTDDTASITEAVYRSIDNGGIPIFGRDRDFYVTSIEIPTTNKWIPVEIYGARTPAARVGTIGNFDVSAPNGMRLISDLTDPTKGVINVAQGGLYLDFNGILLTVRNLSIKTYNNPEVNGINAAYAAQFIAENVDINTGIYSVQASEPTHGTTGIKLPVINNAALNYLRYVSISGFDKGIEVEEHTDGDAILLHSCKHGLYIKEANHASYFKRVLAQRNTNQLTVVGSHVFEIAQMNMEFAGAGQTDPNNAWQATQYEINDPSNLGVGNITYANVKGNVGKVDTCRINGGANLLIKKVGSNTLLTAPGIPG